jgi:hypothetical protein
MAATRGNYPDGRALFERGLRLAVRHRLTEHEAAAHNALLMSAVAAKDVESALTHGWRLLQLSSGRTDRQAEVLVNLAAVALLADNAEAALAGSTEALRLTNDDRVLLAGFGSAATAAARLGRRDLLDRLASDVAHVLERSGHPYDRAYTLLELADAYATVDSTAEARRFLADAVRLANEGPFFEVLHRAETVEQRVAGRDVTPAASKATGAPMSPESAAVLSTDRRAGLSLSAASHRVLQSLAELRS